MGGCGVPACNERSELGAKMFAIPGLRFDVPPFIKKRHERRRLLWLTRINKLDLMYQKTHVRVCSRHFRSGKPATPSNEKDPDWAPSLLLGNNGDDSNEDMAYYNLGPLDGGPENDHPDPDDSQPSKPTERVECLQMNQNSGNDSQFVTSTAGLHRDGASSKIKCSEVDCENSQLDSLPLDISSASDHFEVIFKEEEDLPEDTSWEEGDNNSSTAVNTGFIEQQMPTITISDDEEEELEPVAAVDVLPVREEDFFPEGLIEDVAENCSSPWINSRLRPSEVHQPWNLQEHQLTGVENTHMLPQWAKQQGFFLGAQPTHQLFLKLPNNAWSTHNQLVNAESLSQNNSELRNAHKRYDIKYRKRNPELTRIRNREYARRYRLTHADLVRERQREYVKRRRERNKLGLGLESNSEQSNNVPSSERSRVNTSLLDNASVKEIII